MKRRFPLLQQRDTMDCGPTCLAMICKYYGYKIGITEIRDMCGISREGVSLYGIYHAAQNIGFSATGTQVSLSDLRTIVTLPCILHWNQNHFVILCRIKNNKKETSYYIADPAGAIKLKYNQEELKKCWISDKTKDGDGLGTVLILRPSFPFPLKNEEKKKKIENSALTFLLPYIKLYKNKIGTLVGVLFLGSAIQLLLPFLTQSIVDIGISNKNIRYIVLILIGQLILETGVFITGFIRSWILLKIGSLINIQLISDYLVKLMALPLSFFDSKLTGDIMQRINDHSRIQSFLTAYSVDTLFSMINIIVFGSVMLAYNWAIFLLFAIGSVLYIIWVCVFMKKRENIDHKMFSLNSASQSNIIQLISGMQEIKLNACEKIKAREWKEIQYNILQLSLKGMRLAQWQQSGGLFINQTKNLLITAIVAAFVIQDKITLGMMLSIQYIIGMLNSPINQVIGFLRQYQDAKLSVSRLQEVYGYKDEDDSTKLTKIPIGDIRIENLVFSYDKMETKVTLSNICLQIPKEKKTAFVGLSGSGKTTLLKMILGFYKPDKGSITIGGIDLSDINKHEWRKLCGIVMQDGYIFSDTIYKNIAPNEKKPNIKQVVAAAQAANIDHFINKLPLKYNTKIGNEGHGLSIGQKQRILIARAIYKKPKYLFLDEATNSLDTTNEYEIMKHLHSIMKGKTSIIIAHRLSTIKDADNIIVLDKGYIVEQGNYSQLLQKKGLFYSLVQKQMEFMP